MDKSKSVVSVESFPKFQLRLLGPPVITWSGQPFRLSRRQARSLLYRLALDLQPLPRDALLYLFWPDTDNSTARRNLSRLLSYTSKSLPEDGILSLHADTVRLRPSLAWSDSKVYIDLTSGEASTSSLEEAIGLYRGPFLSASALPDSPEYESWQRGEQQRFERLHLANLGKLIRVKRDAYAYDEAIAYAQQYLAIDELAEEVHRQLILLYAASGDRAAALQQFEQCVMLLERELGVRPLPETRAAYEAARVGQFAPVRKRPTPLWTTLISLDLPLLGRDETWVQLDDACQRYRSGGAVFITGEPGIGKSRLLQEFASSRPQMVLTGNSYASTQMLPYQPIMQALRLALPQEYLWRNISIHWRSELLLLLPELKEYFDDLVEPVLAAPAQAQARLFEVLTQVFTGFAIDAPLLLCLDDLHWADGETLGWLNYLAGRLKGSRLQIIATFRQREAQLLSRLRRVLQRQGLLTEIVLDGLTPETIADLLNRLPQAPDEPGQMAQRLYRETGGNPFFALEIIRVLLERNELVSPPDALPLPETIEETILQRLARLGQIAQQVLETCAILSPLIEMQLVQSTAGRSELEVVDGFDELVEHHLLVAEATRYWFQHDLIRSVVYRNLSYWRRRLLHRRAAQAIGEVHGDALDSIAQMARHHDNAEEYEQAFHYYRQAAGEARQIYANEAAIAYLQRAIALLPEAKAGETMLVELYEALGDTLQLMGRFAAMRKAYQRALLLLPLGNKVQRAAIQQKIDRSYED